MKKKIIYGIVILAVTTICNPSYGQKKARINPDQLHHELTVGIGAMAPIDRQASYGASERLFFSYGRFFHNGLGFRTGINYTDGFMGTEGVVGVPLNIAYHTKLSSFANSLSRDVMSYGYNALWYGMGDNIWEAIGTFLLGLFNRTEVFGGFTPGYVLSGSDIDRAVFSDGNVEEHGTVVNHRFYTTLDFGLAWSYRIWRFTINIAPSYHYCITDNFRHYSSDSMTLSEKLTDPFRNYFGINGALSFMF